jgi:non-ribosomal peptide synthase protein (TIGR01720 family)
VDTARTVGWFTTLVPLVLGGDEAGPVAAVARVSERLRALPAGGIGHGLLRWLGGGEAERRLAALPPVEVSFNYAGRHLDDADAGGLFARATAEATGPAASPGDPRAYLLEVFCGVSAGRLEVTVRYAPDVHRRERVEGFTRAFLDALRALLAAAPAPARPREAQPA